MMLCIREHVINVDFWQSNKGKDFHGMWNFLVVKNIHLCPDEWRGREQGDQEVTPIIEACTADIGALGSHWVASSPQNN